MPDGFESHVLNPPKEDEGGESVKAQLNKENTETLGAAVEHQVLFPMFILAGWLFHLFLGNSQMLSVLEHLPGWNYWYFSFALIASIGWGVLYDRKMIQFGQMNAIMSISTIQHGMIGFWGLLQIIVAAFEMEGDFLGHF